MDQRSGIIWARTDTDARMIVEVDATESFRNPRRFNGPRASAGTDFTAQLEVNELPDGEDIFYRVWFESLDRPGLLSDPMVGHFRTAPRGARDVSFVWSGDTAGQGWGINPDIGGMTIYETIRQMRPDFFIHSGDNIYADGPITASVALPDGRVWHNVVTDEKSKVAETLDEFRGNFKYNLMDENVRRLYAEVPLFSQWDDHETHNNWYPNQILDDARYTVKDVDVLASRSRRAFQEYMPMRQSPDPFTLFYQSSAAGETSRSPLPEQIYRKINYGPLLDVFFLDMRSYRGPNTTNGQASPSEATAFLGQRQVEWLKRELKRSRATWKAIAADMPIGLNVNDGPTTFEAIANANDGTPLGREFEIADLLAFINHQDIQNVVWFTADVHYAAAHYYDPANASFTDFAPFWEFVAGPLNAGTFGPNTLDETFGPVVKFQKGALFPNMSPLDGYQFFGHVSIDGATRVMTVKLIDVAGVTLYTVDLQPQ